MEIKRFAKANAAVWNSFVKEAKNATFLFDRGYMDYHTDWVFVKSMPLFPNHIQLFEIRNQGLLGGTIIYSTPLATHAQYTSATHLGMGALDVLFHNLLNAVFTEKAYFSFGIPNGEPHQALNRGLVNWRERFGARTFAINIYQIDTENHHTLLSSYE
ncbi:MAG: hypothetical protein ORN54_00805 [Cyclobacteriaceae bacterium]|nr:hypothetical protein [Cyclobacteriaceae bacterium]